MDHVRFFLGSCCSCMCCGPDMSALANVQATAGIEDDEDYDDMASRPGNTIGQPSIMNGLNRSMIHTTSTISNAPNVPVQHAPAPVLSSDCLHPLLMPWAICVNF